MRRRSGLTLIGFLVLSQFAGLVGTPFTDEGRRWYRELERPWFDPPEWVFGPVWTALYVLVGLAGWLIWRAEDSHERSLALRLWFVQLALNALWTPLFFGLQVPLLALVEIVLLLVAIVATMWVATRVDVWAVVLLVPYLLWVGFASLLNGSIWWLNRG